MRTRFVTPVIVFALALGAGCRSDRMQCETACRNYAQLTYWDTADAEIAKRPVGERDALRRQKLAEFEAGIAKGIDWCVSKCTSGNFSNQVDCLSEAKTARQARACTND